MSVRLKKHEDVIRNIEDLKTMFSKCNKKNEQELQAVEARLTVIMNSLT